MFTGLVQAVGRVVAVEPRDVGARLVIDAGGWAHRPAVGDSIAVNGACLTVAATDGGNWSFDCVHETLRKTTLGGLVATSRVNLEHAVTASTLMGGHFVQGHIDGVGIVEDVQTGAEYRLAVRPPEGFLAWAVPQGSICIDGVSLTIAGLTGETLTVALIPTTLDKTTLGGLRAGDRVNLEGDMLVKAVVRTVRALHGGTDQD